MRRILAILVLFLCTNIASSQPIEIEYATIFNPAPSSIQIEAGAQLEVVLNSSLNSQSIKNSDTITAELSRDWMHNGVLIAPEGSILSGHAVDSKSATFAFGDGQIGVNFTTLTRPDGSVINLVANKVQINVDDSRARNVATQTLTGVANSAFASGGDWSTLALMSTLCLLEVISRKGEEVQIPAGANIQVKLSQPLVAQAYSL